MLSWLKTYIASPTHKWWVDNVWRPSWTKLMTIIYGVPALFATVFTQLAAWGDDTTIAQYIDKLGMPNWVPIAFAGIALVHYVAHGRSASEST